LIAALLLTRGFRKEAVFVEDFLRASSTGHMARMVLAVSSSGNIGPLLLLIMRLPRH
jgi:hypothetical protein